MRIDAGILLAALLTPACRDAPKGTEAQATTSATTVTAQPLAPRPSTTVTLLGSDPMAAYTPEVVAKYDTRTACLAGCAAALRCRSGVLFSGGSSDVANRLKTCRAGCTGAAVARPGYLEQARACLRSGTCGAFNVCAAGMLPAR